jgi:ribosomal protein L12E/L44/L45/RPP1/RPP2
MTMETMVIKVKNEKAKRLIQDLEELDIIEVLEKLSVPENRLPSNISDLRKRIASPMKEDEINEQLEKIRKEWQQDI